MPIKAILIDPFACKVSHVDLEGDLLQAYYDTLSHETMKVDTVTTAHCLELHGRDAIFVDDEGLFKEPKRFFMLPGTEPLAGKGLIVGANNHGDAADALTPLGNVVRAVTYYFPARGDRGVALLQTAAPWVAPEA